MMRWSLAALALVVLAGCAPAAAVRPAMLPPPCAVAPAPLVPAGDTQRAAALYIERLYAWGAKGWACVAAQQAVYRNHQPAPQVPGQGGAGDL